MHSLGVIVNHVQAIMSVFRVLLREEKQRARRVAGEAGVPTLFERPKVVLPADGDEDDVKPVAVHAAGDAPKVDPGGCEPVCVYACVYVCPTRVCAYVNVCGVWSNAWRCSRASMPMHVRVCDSPI